MLLSRCPLSMLHVCLALAGTHFGHCHLHWHVVVTQLPGRSHAVHAAASVPVDQPWQGCPMSCQAQLGIYLIQSQIVPLNLVGEW